MEIELGAYIYHDGGYRPVPPDVAPSLKERLMETSRLVKDTHPTLFYTMTRASLLQLCAGCFDPNKVAGEISGTPAQDDRRGLAAIIGVEITGAEDGQVLALSAIHNQAVLAELLFSSLDTIQTALQAPTPNSREVYNLWNAAREKVHQTVMSIVGEGRASGAADFERPMPLGEAIDVPAREGAAVLLPQQEMPVVGDTRRPPAGLSHRPAKAPLRGLRLLVAAALLIGLVNTIILILHLAGKDSAAGQDNAVVRRLAPLSAQHPRGGR